MLTGRWYGNEYLQLYRKIDEARTGNLAAWRPGQTSGEWLRNRFKNKANAGFSRGFRPGDPIFEPVS